MELCSTLSSRLQRLEAQKWKILETLKWRISRQHYTRQTVLKCSNSLISFVMLGWKRTGTTVTFGFATQSLHVWVYYVTKFLIMCSMNMFSENRSLFIICIRDPCRLVVYCRSLCLRFIVLHAPSIFWLSITVTQRVHGLGKPWETSNNRACGFVTWLQFIGL